MKISCLQENLSQGLSTVNRVVTTTGSLPVLSHVLLATEKGRLKLAGTDLETGISTFVGAKVEEEGAVTVPAAVFSALITSLPPQKLDLSVKNLILEVKGENTEAHLNGMAAEEFPTLPEKSKGAFLTLPREDFLAALRAVVFAAAVGEGRPILTGILVKIEGGDLVLVGVDGFRLSEKKFTLPKINPEDFPWGKKGIAIPARALKELIRVGSEEEVKFGVEEEGNQVIFKFGETKLCSRLLEGDFPDYQKIIPPSSVLKAEVEKEDLLKGVRLVAIFARDSASIIRLNCDPDSGKITLSANTPEVGENQVELGANLSGEALKIAFNSGYLLDCLNNLSGEEASLQFSGSLSPLLVKPQGDETFLHLIMPVRVQEE